MTITPFETAIKNYLDKLAADDPFFQEKMENPKKSISECCKYIMSEVKKAFNSNNGVCAVSDSEVYGLAAHYYDEENLVVEETKGDVKVAHVPEVSTSAPAKKPRKPKATKEAPVVPPVEEDPDEFIPEPLDIPLF